MTHQNAIGIALLLLVALAPAAAAEGRRGFEWFPVEGTGVHYLTTAVVHSQTPTVEIALKIEQMHLQEVPRPADRGTGAEACDARVQGEAVMLIGDPDREDALERQDPGAAAQSQFSERWSIRDNRIGEQAGNGQEQHLRSQALTSMIKVADDRKKARGAIEAWMRKKRAGT